MWGSIISAAVPLIGGLFGKKKKQEPQVVKNEVDYVKMRDNAEAAGFNPLTALRNGGSAGFGTQTSMMPSMTNSNIWADAAGAMFNAWNDYDPMKQSREKLSDDLMRAQLANIEADTRIKLRPDAGARNRRSMDIPKKIGSTVTGGTSTADAPLGAPVAPEAGDSTVTNPWAEAYVDPTVRDAQQVEDRMGDSELISTGYGLYVGAKDMLYNRKLKRQEAEKYWEKKFGKDHFKKAAQANKAARDKRVNDFKTQTNNLHKRNFGNGAKSFW